jgi:glycosyltransferase involved in cell wall biosynthesis
VKTGLVSVIIPTYNYAHFVLEAVESALAQTYPDREIIVVDDGSTDATGQVLQPYLDRIRYIFQPNGGLSAARNTGIEAAQGEFIALLDSDDVWHPRKLELQVDYLNQHPEIGLLATDQITDRSQGWPALADPASIRPLTFPLDKVVGKAHFGPSSAVIRRICFYSVGLFDPTLRCVEDRDMWIRLASKFVLAKLPLTLLWYRLHPTSLSNKSVQMEEAELRVLHKAFRDIPGLRGRWLFHMKTLSQTTFVSAQMFGTHGQLGIALRRVLRSFLLWPLPYRRDDVDVSFARARSLAVLCLRMLGLAQLDPASAPAPAYPVLAGTGPRLTLNPSRDVLADTRSNG